MVKVEAVKKLNSGEFLKRAVASTRLASYVGVPATTSQERSDQLLKLAGKTKSVKKKRKLVRAAKEEVNNAELLFIFTEGSPARKQPARPVLKPAVAADGNREPIAFELAGATRAALEGDRAKQINFMRRAALAGQNAARGWFTDKRNGWAPNAPSTIAAKGSARPGIDTGAMRAVIQGIVGEDS